MSLKNATYMKAFEFNTPDLKADRFCLYNIKQRASSDWTEGGTRGGMITNIYDGDISTEDYINILSNIVDKLPFKSIIAKQNINGNYIVDSIVIKVAMDSYTRLLADESINLHDGRIVKSGLYPIGHFESFNLEFIIIKPSEVNKIDYSRIFKY